MDELHSVSRDEALREIADSPATLEFRAVALDRQAGVYRSGGGLIVVDAHERLVGALGAIYQRDIEAVCRARTLDCELLADGAAYERLCDKFAFERAILQTLSRPWRRTARRVAGLTIRLLEPADAIDHLPGELREKST